MFLCKEGNELFTIEATSLENAIELASIYNAVVIREVYDK